jgi:hypothetical protein
MCETCSLPAHPVIQADSDERIVESCGFPPLRQKKLQERGTVPFCLVRIQFTSAMTCPDKSDRGG